MGDATAGLDFLTPEPTVYPTPSGNAPPAVNPNASKYTAAAEGFSILSGLLKGMSAIQSAGYNAATARGNATISDEAAGDAILRGQVAAQSALLRGGALAAKQKTAFAGSGVSVNSGSAVDVLSNTSLMSDLDAATITANASRDAWGYRTKADQFNQQANIDEAEGRNQLGSSILGGVVGAATYGTQTMLPLH